MESATLITGHFITTAATRAARAVAFGAAAAASSTPELKLPQPLATRWSLFRATHKVDKMGELSASVGVAKTGCM